MSVRTLILAACACLVWLSGANAQEQWVKVSDNLTETVEDYDGTVPGARGIGGVAVDRHTGDVIMGLNGPPYGLYRSSDAGETWTRIDGGNVEGGWIRSFSIRIDNDMPGRICAFRVTPPGPAKSALTLDGGKTWQQIEKPWEYQGFGDWRHGMVDWSQDPVHIIACNRIRPAITLSTNGGEKFEKTPGGSWGVVDWSHLHNYIRKYDENKLKRFKTRNVQGYGVYKGYVLMGRYDTGIERVAIDAEEPEYEPVSDHVVCAYTPVVFQGKIYWGAEKGLIVSADSGKTWELLGSELPNVNKGPFFGKDENNIVVATRDGVYRTKNAGESWNKVCALFKVEDAWRSDRGPLWLHTDYAWDHTRSLLYVAGLAGSAYKKEIE